MFTIELWNNVWYWHCKTFKEPLTIIPSTYRFNLPFSTFLPRFSWHTYVHMWPVLRIYIGHICTQNLALFLNFNLQYLLKYKCYYNAIFMPYSQINKQAQKVYRTWIKTSGSESRGQEEAACARHQAYTTTTVSYYTDESSNFLKCCSSAAVTAIA